jgi:hypothetical protein
MEFLVLTSQFRKQPMRERIIMQAVIELAQDVGVERIIMRRTNVFCTGVYLSNSDGKSLLYNDWEKDWDQKKIIRNMKAKLQASPIQDGSNELVLTIA